MVNKQTDTELLYPSEFFYRYAIEKGPLKVKVRGKLVDVPLGSQCFFCGRRDFVRGYNRKEAEPATFMDQPTSYPYATHACIYCNHVFTGDVKSKAVYLVTRDGFKGKEDGIHMGQILLDPPKPPFLFGFGDGHKHTIPKNKVNVSQSVLSSYVIFKKEPVVEGLVTLNRLDAVSLADDLVQLMVALNTTSPLGIAKSSFGSKRLATLTEEDLALYQRIKREYGAYNQTLFGALRIIKYRELNGLLPEIKKKAGGTGRGRKKAG